MEIKSDNSLALNPSQLPMRKPSEPSVSEPLTSLEREQLKQDINTSSAYLKKRYLNLQIV